MTYPADTRLYHWVSYFFTGRPTYWHPDPEPVMNVAELPTVVDVPGLVAGNGEGMHEGGKSKVAGQVGPLATIPLGMPTEVPWSSTRPVFPSGSLLLPVRLSWHDAWLGTLNNDTDRLVRST